MRRLLGLLIAFGLLTGQGFSVAAATCHHHSARDHAIARESHDSRIAIVALTEESAASVVEKKGALSGGSASSFSALADLLPAAALLVPEHVSSDLAVSAGDAAKLAGISITPLLKPPLA